MLGLHGLAMLVPLEDLLYVTGHQEVNGADIVIPPEFDATVEVTRPIFGKFIAPN